MTHLKREPWTMVVNLIQMNTTPVSIVSFNLTCDISHMFHLKCLHMVGNLLQALRAICMFPHWVSLSMTCAADTSQTTHQMLLDHHIITRMSRTGMKPFLSVIK
jgi:hypothetical protein